MLKLRVLILCLCVSALFSCKSKQSETSSEPSRAPLTQVDPNTAATITGVIKFEGDAPKPQLIEMSQDSACGKGPNFDESLLVINGNLKNVFVYVKSGLNGNFGAPAKNSVITQRGCAYTPHVMGVLTGQKVQIVNADQTTHNIHPMPTSNKPWNESQLPKQEPIESTFTKQEIMFPVKCNQHPWMRMYLSVVDHPFFAVTGEDGKFTIKGLPPGEYTIAAVHEKLGEQEVKVTVGPKESANADFTFKASPESKPGL